MNYVYILQCSDGTFYTGYTNNLKKRILNHNSGHGSKYTRGRCPVKLVYYETYETKNEALKREFEIKKLARIEKAALISSGKSDISKIEPVE